MRKPVLLMLVGACGLSGVAVADTQGETVYYPGLLCKYYGRQGSDSYFNPSGYSANGLKNASSSERTVACPISKPNYDVQQSTSDRYGNTKGADITLSFDDDNCRLYRRSIDSATSAWWAADEISQFSSGLWWHRFVASTYFATHGYSLSLYCSIPAEHYVNNYAHTAYWR